MDSIELYNGVKLPLIGAGTFPYKDELLDAVPNMVETGFRLLDTSDNYGNEQHLGKAIARVSEDELDSLIIVTKYSNPLKGVKEAFEESCEKIYRETSISNRRPDIYLMHWPYPYLWENRWREMEQLYMEGRIRAIGVCNFTEKYLKKLLSICQVLPMINQFECHPMFQQRETIELCKKSGIKVMSYSPLARMNKNLFDNEVLKKIAMHHNKTIGQVILNWNISEGRIPIPASKSVSHIQENFDSLSFRLSEGELRAIDSLESGMRIRFDPDTRFSFRQKLRFFIHSAELRLGLK